MTEQNKKAAPLLIDGIVIPKLTPSLFAEMRNGGLSCTTVMTSVWDDPAPALHNLAAWRAAVAASPEARLVRSVADIEAARSQGQVAIVIGWQNSDGFGEDLGTVQVFHDAGLRVVSPCFNHANAAGGGCADVTDRGLTDFGHGLVACLNEQGILIDLTHAGDTTGSEVIKASAHPVCYTHAGAKALNDARRNKTDDQLQAIADQGGVVGIAALPHFLPSSLASTMDDYVRVVGHVLNVVGEDHIAVGTDLIPGQDRHFVEHTSRRKGRGPLAFDYAKLPQLSGFSEFTDYPAMLARLDEVMTPRQQEKFLGLNWLRLYTEVWHQG